LALHLLRLCVGTEDVAELRRFQAGRLFAFRGAAATPGFTRRMPTRRAEVLDGGSMYWIIKGAIRVRQRILDLQPHTDAEGKPGCRIVYDPTLVETETVPHRPMQGWRYLPGERAPGDLNPAGAGDGPGDGPGDGEELPADLRRELRMLGILY
jgi:hypothetical protein